MQPEKISLVAGEASGDLLGAMLLAELRKTYLTTSYSGIGGTKMQAQGFTAWWSSQQLAVRGYWEVIKRLRHILAIRRQLTARLLTDKPDLFIGIDAPDFNLDLEVKLKQQGIKTVHFVSPSIWAWRPERIEKIRQAADLVLCIFPFEVAIYQQQNIAACYVGHPLANAIDYSVDTLVYKQQLHLTDKQPVLAVLPGSNASEVKYNLPVFLQTVQILLQQQPLQVLLPTLGFLKPQVVELVERFKLTKQVKISLDNSRQVLAACDVTLIASGTATLEAALLKKPMVIGYRVSWLTAQIMGRKKLQPWVGLPNILCQEFVVPEFLQHQATPANFSQQLRFWLDNPRRVEQLKQRFNALHLELKRDTGAIASAAIKQLLEH